MPATRRTAEILGLTFGLIACSPTQTSDGELFTFAGAQAEPQLYDGVPLDATLLRLDRRALDEAYHAQLVKLFGVWLADGAKHPQHITNGLRNARRAYGLAAEQISKREAELKEQQK